MFRLVVCDKKKKPAFELHFENEFELYNGIYTLETTVKGVAYYIVYCFNERFFSGYLGEPPRNVYNAFDTKTYSFSHFLRHSFDFPLMTRLRYRSYFPGNPWQIYGLQ